MDFFTVPTLTFGVLYCFFLIAHDRRKILDLNAIRNPQALRIVQQLREAWPYTPVHRFLLFDRDAKTICPSFIYAEPTARRVRLVPFLKHAVDARGNVG